MKLYHNGQLEGWQIPGQQEKKAARIDVPSSPAELAAWLNHRRVGPTGAAAEHDRQLEQPGEEKPWIMGPAAKDPERYATKFGADVAAGVEFVPVTKAAEIDRLLERCPMCHHDEIAAQHRRDRLDFESVRAWVRDKATSLELDDLSDLIEEKRK